MLRFQIIGETPGKKNSKIWTRSGKLIPSAKHQKWHQDAMVQMAAQKFAKDSRSKLGKIKTANQGAFTIENRDSNTPYIKTVRVVTSVTYYLKN